MPRWLLRPLFATAALVALAPRMSGWLVP